MKKYLLSLFAVLLAFTFSAFSPAPETAATNEDYFWYNVEFKTLISGTASAVPPNGCLISGGDVCAYGCESATEEHPDEEYLELARYQ